jgi:acyl-CoA synthetase (AMP-forming)/AMP-acid ligase II
MIGLPTLLAGGRWSLPPVTARVDTWVRQAAQEGASHAYAVPAKALAAAEVGLPSTVRQLGLGGAPVLPAAVRRLSELAPDVAVRAVYGLTEALPVAVATGPEVLASPDGLTALGRPLPGVTVRVERPDAAGIGELVVSGPQTRDRLAGQPPAVEVHTGDLGRLAPDGSLLLAGRAKNMIIRGQANIYPDLVEPLLRDLHRGQLADCALVGLTDPLSGDERVVLAVTRSGTRASVASTARAVHRSWGAVADEAWRPDEVVLVPAIPRRGRSGAVDLEVLRALVAVASDGDRA